MKIICAASVTQGQEAFSTLGPTTILAEKLFSPELVREADALAIRSKVTINRALVEGSRLAFVGTATAGTDHMDLDMLGQREIAWCAAPGCNANSVSEYVVSGLLCLAARHGFTLAGKTIGIIGAGHVGRLVAGKARALGLQVLLNDPPLKDKTGRADFLELRELLHRADILTLHVPLNETGPYKTRGLADDAFFGLLKPGCLFINASRGEVVLSDSLLKARESGCVAHMILDVFENEPVCVRSVMERADLISPHIAGHSYDGKLNGTVMVYREAANFFEVEQRWKPGYPDGAPQVHLDAGGLSVEEALWLIVRQVYDIQQDDALLRAVAGLGDVERGRSFEKHRSAYPVRHEFPRAQVEIARLNPELATRLTALGFNLR